MAQAPTTEKSAPPSLDPRRHALFLDFDGVLVEIAPTPDAVRVEPALLELLGYLSLRFDGALAVISGRRIADIDTFLAPLLLPASGVHGQEVRTSSGEIRTKAPSPQIAEARHRLQAEVGPGDRLRLEDKKAALVLHFREHADQAERARALAEEATDGLGDLHVVPGHAIAEIRERGVDKAGAIRTMIAAPPFSGRPPVFVGDDVTDEDGFQEVARSGGFGVKVGPGDTAAAYQLPDVAAVHRWLATFA